MGRLQNFRIGANKIHISLRLRHGPLTDVGHLRLKLAERLQVTCRSKHELTASPNVISRGDITLGCRLIGFFNKLLEDRDVRRERFTLLNVPIASLGA